jgi:cell filamentation protein, protein adenylyltransferase
MVRVAIDPNVVTAVERPSGRVVRVGRGDLAYEAFVPHPLPATFDRELALLNALSAADRSLGELAGVGRLLPNPDLLIDPFIRREAVLSSKIEGTQATITDVYAFEAEQSGGARRRPPTGDVQEVINYISAMSYGLRRIHELPISLRLLKELHGRLMKGVRGEDKQPGEFRHSQNWIGAPNCLLADASYVPPPISEMEVALSELELYVHATEELDPPLLRLAMIHAQFEMIHPFMDGNGRIGRLLISLLLVHWNILPLPLLYLSAFFERERDLYYERLQALSAEGDWAGWFVFFLRGVESQARDAAERAKRLQDLQAEWRGRFSAARSSALLLKLVDYLFQAPVITVPRAQRLLGVTYPSARHSIDKLVEAGVLEPFGEKAYGRPWWAPRIMGIVS